MAPNDASRVFIRIWGFTCEHEWRGFLETGLCEPADQNGNECSDAEGEGLPQHRAGEYVVWGVTWADKGNHIVAGYSDIKGMISADGGNYMVVWLHGAQSNSMYRSVKHPLTGVLYAGPRRRMTCIKAHI